MFIDFFSCRTRVILGYLQILKSFIDLVSCGTRGDKSGEVPTGLASLPPYTPAPRYYRLLQSTYTCIILKILN